MRWFILAVFIMAIIVFGIAAGVAAVDALGLIIARFGYVGGFGALVLHITLVGFAFPPTMYFVLWLFGWLLDRISAKPAHDRPITSERLGSFQGLSAREMEMWSNKAELEAALRAAGLGEWASRLAALARHSIIFVPCSIEDGAAAPIGASRLGGQPDLPPDVDWPARPPVDVEGTTGPVPGGLLFGPRHWLRRHSHTGLETCVAAVGRHAAGGKRCPQSRLAAELRCPNRLCRGQCRARLGRLPVCRSAIAFCDPYDWPWGATEDQARVRVIFTEVPAERLQRRRPPQEFDEPSARQVMPTGYVFRPRVLCPTVWLLPPPLAFAEQPRAWAPPKWPAWSAYEQFWRDLYARHPKTFGPRGEMIHQMGGTAFSIQHPVEAECVRFAEHSPRSSRRRRGDVHVHAPAGDLVRASDWQLVLQIDSDVEVGMEWGDVGRLYLCAPKHDLATARFDRCWMVMQCY